MMMMVILILFVPLVYGYHNHAIPPSIRPNSGVQLYLPFENITLQNYSVLYGGQFYHHDLNSDGIYDALYCQSANNDSNIGVWYYPDGTQVSMYSYPVYIVKSMGQIALYRSGSLRGYEGLYTCIIPDENGTNHTLVAGIYRTATYNTNDGPDADPSMMFSLISTRDANPPVFTLSFNVSDEPPTDVTCTDGTNPLTIASSDLSRVIVNGPRSVTQVTVTARTKLSPAYQCTVSNARVTAGTIGDVTAVNSTSTAFSYYFQFKIKRVKSDCLTWSLTETQNFENAIKNKITYVIRDKCPSCPFSIFYGEFVCTGDPLSPTYRGLLFNTNLFLIQNWLKNGATFVYDMRRYHIDERCPVIIKSFDVDECKFHL